MKTSVRMDRYLGNTGHVPTHRLSNGVPQG